MRLIYDALPIAALLLLSTAATAASDSAPDRFDIGGRAIRLACQGTGEPAVIVDAGMGTAPAEDEGWQRIAARIASSTRVCLYNRAGLGGSDPAPGTRRTSADAADDLDKVLSAAHLRPPFVLVGHSIGGLHAQVFASRYPTKVAALVLVSSTHADQMRIWRNLLPPPATGDPKPLVEARRFLTTMENDPSQKPGETGHADERTASPTPHHSRRQAGHCADPEPQVAHGARS